MSIYLSRLSLNLQSTAVRRDLSDVHQLHRTIMSQFDPTRGNRAAQRVLYRLDSGRRLTPTVLIQSLSPPCWALEDQYVLRPPETKDVERALASIVTGQRLRFRLRANPTRRQPARERPNAPRLPLTDWESRAGWLTRKMAEAGATPIDEALDIVAQPRDTGNANGHRITVWPVLFDGILTVEDPDLLRQALVAGIGPARAYGNGLLSLAPTQ